MKLKTTWVVGQSGHTAEHNTLSALFNAALSVPDVVGNNITDDAPAIQAALDAHAVVRLPTANYRLNSALTVSGTLLADPSTSLFYHGSGPAIYLGKPTYVPGVNNAASDSRLSGLIVRGDYAQAGATGIQVVGVGHFTLERVRVTGFASGPGVELYNYVVIGAIRDCYLGSNAVGLRLTADVAAPVMTMVTVDETRFNANATASVDTSTPGSVATGFIEDFLFRRCAFEANQGGTYLDEIRHVLTLDSCWIEENDDTLRFGSTAAGFPWLIRVQDCHFMHFTPYLTFTAGQQVVVAGNVFIRPGVGDGHALSVAEGVTVTSRENYVDPPLVYP